MSHCLHMDYGSRWWCVLALSGIVAGCGPDPEKVGDACDIDDGVEACPGELVCARRGDEDICLYPPGGICDPNLDQDYCQDGACVEDGDGGFVCAREIEEGGACDPQSEHETCVDGTVCAELADGGHACHPPVLLRGMVFDSMSEGAIEGALVLAFDDQATAVTDVATTDVGGFYELDVPIPRDGSGAPVGDYIITLRASAADYQTFPGGIRTALPIASSEAGSSDAGWVIESALTDIALIALPAPERGQSTISGQVLAGDLSGGVLVVAQAGDVGISGVSDKAGFYTIFNVPDGGYDVRGYAADVQLVPEAVDVAGADLVDVDLAESTDGLGTVTGSVNIVNAPGGSATSVVLVVASTFNDTFVRGEVPRGLRSPLSGAPNVDGSFTIAGVPEGSYVVLAAFENDDLVRDPDPNIAGTQIVTVDMPSPGQTFDLESFKITEALAVVSPGQSDPEPVSAAPTLIWADDSSEDFYTLVVYDAYGELVWCLSDLMMGCDGGNVDRVTGGGNVEVTYGGPLESGMYYQFRATSWRQSGQSEPGPISQTEDLRGVFYFTGD